MKILRTAVIGLGRIGWHLHLPQIRQNDGFELVAAVDTNEERLNEMRAEYGANGYTDLVEMLEAEKPDLVVVASPTHLHMEHAICAMEHGADVFLDKPAARNTQELVKIKEAAERTGRKIMVYQPHRAMPAVNLLREIINQDKIGEIFMIKRCNSGYSRRNDWQAKREFGGGMLNNYGAHYVDQMRYLLGEKLTVKTCITDVVATLGDADDVVKAVFTSDSGITVDLDINQATGYEVTPWMVFGKYGTIICRTEKSSDGCEFCIRYLVPDELPKVELQEGLMAKDRKYNPDSELPWHEETVKITPDHGIVFYRKCYEYFALDEKPFVPLDETLELMRIIDTCHEIAEA